MPERQSFKYNVPGISYQTPGWGGAKVDGVPVVDEFLIEYVEPNKQGYVKLPEGSPHPDVIKYPSHRLLKEEIVEYGTNKRYWCNGYRCQDQYNYNINYSGESASHPIFQRRYLERRDQQSRLANGTKFSGIYLIQILVTGSGYDPKNPPTISFTGGGGSGAAALAVVGEDGTLQWIYLTSEGSGYTSEPTVNISGGGGAIAVAKLNFDTGVLATITVTNGGTGYVGGATVNISGGGGSGAQAVAQVVGGVIKAVSVVSNGTGFTVAPGISFSGILGSGATATSTIETVSMQLVKEDVEEFGEDDPRRSLYVIVVRTYESLPGPVLIEWKHNEFLDTYIRVQKRIVSALAVPPDMFYQTVTPGQIEEYQPLSKWRSVQILSSLNSKITWEDGGHEAADVTYYGTANWTFPNEIHDNPSVNVYFALSGNLSLDIAFGWSLNVLEGYSGPCVARFVRRYTLDPTNAAFQAALPTVTQVFPQAHVINDGFVYNGGNTIAQATQFVLPSALHPELTIDTTGTSPPVNDLPGPIETIPATVPPSIPSGTEICVSVKPTLYDFGLWVYDFIFIQKP